MKSAVSAHPKEQMADLLATLRSYAKRVLLQGDLLTLSEAQGKSSRMNQFLQMGADYKCTDKEMVGLVCQRLLK